MKELIQLIEYLKTVDASVIKYLQGGLSNNQIREILEGTGLSITKEIESLYNIVNGTAPSNDYLGLQYLFPGHIILSLEKAVELYNEECLSYNSWELGYLPIFWNGNRDYLLIDCLNNSEGVYFYSPDEFRFDKIPRKYDTLNMLFDTVLRCFEVNAYQLGKTLEDIKYEGDIVIAISKELNPNSEYWNF